MFAAERGRKRRNDTRDHILDTRRRGGDDTFTFNAERIANNFLYKHC
jgi:hypothetical protein